MDHGIPARTATSDELVVLVARLTNGIHKWLVADGIMYNIYLYLYLYLSILSI